MVLDADGYLGDFIFSDHEQFRHNHLDKILRDDNHGYGTGLSATATTTVNITVSETTSLSATTTLTEDSDTITISNKHNSFSDNEHF